MKEGRAVFLDRDGVLNDLVYDREEGRVTSPRSARDLKVFPFAAEAVRKIRGEGFRAVVISNQPGVAKRQFTLAELEKMNSKIRRALAREGTRLDAEYYCLHHPGALVAKYRVDCVCRKPKPGLLIRAAKDHNLDLGSSYFVGDSLSDVKAGKSAGCRTVLVGHMTTALVKLMDEEGVTPDHVVGSLEDVPGLISRLEK